MTKPIVTVFGGSGFIGRHVVRCLARRGYRIRAAVRRPTLAHFLRPMGMVGQIELFKADVRDEISVSAAINGAEFVVNLVGILHEHGRQRFGAIQRDGAARIARLAKVAGVKHLIQVSAIGADANAPSRYARSKGEGEIEVRKVFPDATILRPSIVFGPEDDFFNRFASMASHPICALVPLLPLVGRGATRFQPVFAGDVAEAVARCLDEPDLRGRTYELGGPQVLNFKECLQLMLRQIDRRRLLVPLPFALATAIAFFLQIMPKPLLTPDQVTQLRRDNVVGTSDENATGTIIDLDIRPVAVDVILPLYLVRYRPAGQFTVRSADQL